MEKEKSIDIGQGIDAGGFSIHRMPLGVFVVMKDENGEEREVNIKDIVGSKGKEEDK